MNLFQTFFYSLKRSLLSPDYYQDILKAKFSFSLKFFFLVCFLFGLIMGAFYSQKANQSLKEITKDLENLPDFYPKNLVVSIKNGEVSTNQTEPLFVPLPSFQKPEPSLAQIQNLVVIDTNASIEDIAKYQTVVLVTKNNFVVKTSEYNQELRAYSLKEIKNFTLDEALAKDLWQKISQYFKYLPAIVTIAVFLFTISLSLSVKFTHLLLFSLIALIFAKILKTSLTYKQVLQINLHAFILPTLVQSLFALFGLADPFIFFYSLVLLIFNLVIFASMREKEAPVTPHQP